MSNRAKNGQGQQGSPRVIEIAPIAPRAQMQRRHWGLVLSIVIFLILPLLATGWYLWTRSVDQYASTAGFTVRREDGGAGTDLLGGVASQIAGGSTQSDTDILYEFIQSQELVSRIHKKFDLVALYSPTWEQDPVFSIWPDATIEDLLWYWGRIVRVSYDQSSGLLDLRILAFQPDKAQAIAEQILAESQVMINALNASAREEAIGYAQEDLERARARLKKDREDLVVFRTRTQIVDPQTDLQGRLGVVNNLQGQLAQALIEQDLLREQAGSTDPRVKQATRRIEVIRDRIAQERQNVAAGDATVVGDDYPSLLAEYEGLVAERQFSEESYRAALTAVDIANTKAQRQSRYLAVYANPTLSERSEYPRRYILFGLAALFLTLIWSVLALIYYSVRDSR